MYKVLTLLSTAIIFLVNSAQAQTIADTLQLSFPEAEKVFLQNNLSLLAGKYNVDINKALVQQARLWDNPILTTDQNIYDKQGDFFKHNSELGT